MRYTLLLLAAIVTATLPSAASEPVSAAYFDIECGAGAGTEVIGALHPVRNKDAHSRPIPAAWRFEIARQPAEALLAVDTRRDSEGRLTGVLTVAPGRRMPAEPADYTLTVALRDGSTELGRYPVTVHVVDTTLYSLLYSRYLPRTLSVGRLWGRTKYKDRRVAELIGRLEANGWRWPGLELCYERRPEAYTDRKKLNREKRGSIEFDWGKVVDNIGGLGRAYSTSAVYGPEGDPARRAELRRALYHTILTYIDAVPVDGWDIQVGGSDIGSGVGDGFSLLQSRGLAGMQTPTHQWMVTDGLITPLVHLMPDILRDKRRGDPLASRLHDRLVRYFQLFFSIVKGRRAIDDPGERWGELRDTIYSSGAWADANLGHRSRTMLAIPLIWADYNRPITYVPYWYRDFYAADAPFPGFSFSTGWEPTAVIDDLAYWQTKFCIPAHRYRQSGFQPDGAISHHIGQGTDMSMTAYGFEWLTGANDYYSYFRDTPWQVADTVFQFQADRLARVYPLMFYRGRMDFLAAGRNFLGDQRAFVTGDYLPALDRMMAARGASTVIEGLDSLVAIADALRRGDWECSASYPFWVTEYAVHRRRPGDEGGPFFASLKLKSRRTVGAEDFSRKVRRSWHAGYGIMPVRVTGDEYSECVLGGYDWHVLPGLTEEWRADPMPLGHSQASLPGDNTVAGVLADGRAAMGIYHHLPREKYSSATARKSYHMIADRIASQGSAIARMRPGQGRPIVTTVDQSALTTPLVWDGGSVMPGESRSLVIDTDSAMWLHTGAKGYVILGPARVRVVTGDSISVTDPSVAECSSPAYIIAIDHGADPAADAGYGYVVLPGATAAGMPALAASLAADMHMERAPGVHTAWSQSHGYRQYAFFEAGSGTAGGITVSADSPAQLMLAERPGEWILSAQLPEPDGGRRERLVFDISEPLAPGVYSYDIKGVDTVAGETVAIEPTADGGSRVTVELPDARDAAHYRYQSDLYQAAPVVVAIPRAAAGQ